MSLIKSISGIRGTIGGPTGDTLNPLDIVKFTSAYATFIRQGNSASNAIVVGRDARLSGKMVRDVVCGTLMGMGCDVIDIGLATTPTTELAVTMSGAAGGIIITASHNPRHWNALKLLNGQGEFLTAADGAEVLRMAAEETFVYADVDHLGRFTVDNSFNARHVETVLNLKLVDVEAIKSAHFKVVVDSINSVGGIILPELLSRLGVEYIFINGDATGDFAHNPEPVEKNLSGIMSLVREGGYDMGIVVDPDVDRLAFISEDGTMFGEEYTLVAVADYVLSKGKGPCSTVSNLSSTRALSDVTRRYGGTYSASAVGEVNVTTMMKQVGAVVGGEGNGGVIYPECHYGRDALVGIALFLSSLAQKRLTMTQFRATFPVYHMAKNRLDLQPGTDIDAIFDKVKEQFGSERITDTDGVKIDFPDKWVHLRKSNTEPIIRVYSEAHTQREADEIAREIMERITKELKNGELV